MTKEELDDLSQCYDLISQMGTEFMNDLWEKVVTCGAESVPLEDRVDIGLKLYKCMRFMEMNIEFESKIISGEVEF